MNATVCLVQNTTRLQKTRGTKFPQQAAFLAVVAFAPGRRVDGFSTDFESIYSHVDCSHMRKFALLDGIELPPQPL